MRVPAGKAIDSKIFDKNAIERGIPSLILMENAAFSIYEAIKELLEHRQFDKIVVFSGNGGNGGDGFALLRILADRMPAMPLFLVTVSDFKEENKRSENAAWFNRNVLPAKVRQIDFCDISGRVLFVDAMLGTGLKCEISGRIKEAVDFINAFPEENKFVVAVDIPTGLNSDSGKIMGSAVKAGMTVTMGIYKTGLFAEKGPACCGKTVLGKISANLFADQHFDYFVEENPCIKNSEAEIDGFKNRNGHLLVIGGEIDKLGATIISAKSFLACGGGLVTAAFKKEFLPSIAGKMPGLMLLDNDEISDKMGMFSAVVIGPGLASVPFDFSILKNFEGVIIVDAGMFDILSENQDYMDVLKEKKVVFTPHQGELRRFLKPDCSEAWISQVERFPLEKNHVLVAKSHATFVKNFEKTVIVPAGAKALAFGGSGDALTGILACETQFSDIFEGTVNAVLRHRAAGIELEKRFSAKFHDIEKLVEMIGATNR